MGCLRSFSPLANFSLPLRTKEQDHGDMAQVNELKSRDFVNLQKIVLIGSNYLFLIMGLDIGWFCGFIAEYGVPLMVLLWSALSCFVTKKEFFVVSVSG
jgi:hypothetical protein